MAAIEASKILLEGGNEDEWLKHHVKLVDGIVPPDCTRILVDGCTPLSLVYTWAQGTFIGVSEEAVRAGREIQLPGVYGIPSPRTILAATPGRVYHSLDILRSNNINAQILGHFLECLKTTYSCYDYDPIAQLFFEGSPLKFKTHWIVEYF